MADRRDLDFTYSLIDRLFRLSLGEQADFSGAKFDGDFSLTLEQAQRRKHDFIVEQVGIRPGTRILDMGCGWGPMLRRIREEGAEGVGLTLSTGQVKACRRHGLDARLMDCRTATRAALGGFDGVVSLGAFEHFCSIDDYLAGRQEEIYGRLFATVHELLPPGGRFYLQTMVFGPNMLPYEAIDLAAPRDSDAFVLALMTKQFPGSWLPYGEAQLRRVSAPYFRLCSSSSGRLDYIETIRQWRQRFAQRRLRKLPLYLSLLPRWLASADFRLAFTSGVSANSLCFERELFEHHRLVFERL
ncbi:MAG TPA: class I SAM-dependent methyltransferase [Gemmatimonadales bacterium]|nr:class I SAM-dependent methyltransferase [Gemmatimonadales bacterium]